MDLNVGGQLDNFSLMILILFRPASELIVGVSSESQQSDQIAQVVDETTPVVIAMLVVRAEFKRFPA